MKRKRKNRKKQAQGFVFPVPLALFLVVVTITSMAYLWMHARTEAAGRRIQKLEQTRQQTRQRMLDEELKWSRLRTLPNVEKAVERHNLNMTWASGSRVVRLARPAGFDDLRVHSELAQLEVGMHE